METIKLVLDGERPISWNRFYSGKHFAVRKNEADRVHLMVRGKIDPHRAIMFAVRVDIVVRVYFDRYPYDSCNIPAKLYIDALKGWYILDDDIKFVASTKTEPHVDRDRPRVEIDIIPRESDPVWKTVDG